ncbi:Crp/Fnr family transcriptional regulator [Pseudoxanthomonas dokdonensis]|uniref:CRP-like protein Clp n=2 Tax=Pseudoxanthomonas dokdonensis TaxID=344882 RepID=A0A0R0D149_9GAMM|nr:Crp/Fnr family transcriptional regulator [Pseudoxanthomonas dokdonensis]
MRPGNAGAVPLPCDVCRVQALGVCAALPAECRRALAAEVRLRGVAADQSLVREGEPRRDAFTVTHGALRRVRLLADGRRLVAGFLMPGDFIGFGRGGEHRHTIEAVVDSHVCSFPQRDLAQLCAEQPALERELMARACAELDGTRDKLMGLARLTPLERLAGFLLDMSARRSRRGLDPAQLCLPMSRLDIADHLGLTIETVSRCFTRLRGDGLIATGQPQQVSLLDVHGLRALAQMHG